MRRTLWIEKHWPLEVKEWAWQFNELITMKSLACLKFFYNLPARLLAELESEERTRFARKRARWRDTKSKKWYSIADYSPKYLKVATAELVIAHRSRDPEGADLMRSRYLEAIQSLERHEQVTKAARASDNIEQGKQWDTYVRGLR